MPPSLIAVLSDTHDHLPENVVAKLAAADEIWHLGDVCSPWTLTPIQALEKPLFIVRGNCDASGTWPESLTLERHGKRFRLQHHPPKSFFAPDDAILYGHLHRPLQEDWQGIRLLNPGAITRPRGGSRPSFAWIRFASDGSWTWAIQEI